MQNIWQGNKVKLRAVKSSDLENYYFLVNKTERNYSTFYLSVFSLQSHYSIFKFEISSVTLKSNSGYSYTGILGSVSPSE